MSFPAHAASASRRWITLLIVASLSALTIVMVAPVSAAPTITGYRDFSYTATSASDPSEDKPQSKVWFTDGFWWAGLLNADTEKYQIYRLDLAGHTWIDTGVALDDRNSSHADYLWDESDQKLFVASTTSGGDQLVYRFSYAESTNTYSLDSGFPATVGTGGSESITIAKDSTDQLWVTFTQPNSLDLTKRDVLVNYSTSDQATWGPATVIPAQVEPASGDDISAIIAFGGNKIGVLWSSQNPVENQEFFYWAERLDTDPDTTWAVKKTAAQGPEDFAEDHVNVKLAASDSGHVVATVKANASTTNIWLLEYSGATWSKTSVWKDPGDPTRPQLVVDDEHDVVYVFATTHESGGDIVYKSAPLSDVGSITTAAETTFISGGTDLINNVSTSKQNVNSDTGLLAIATDDTEYFHNYLPLADHPLTDIAGTPFEDAIVWLYDNGITTGCTATTYCPNAKVTRQEMATFISRAMSLPSTTNDYFTDDETSGLEPFINSFREAELTTGCTADGLKFCPLDNVTRQEMATFLARALELPSTSTDYFTDDETTHLEPFINSFREAGITTGCGPTTFCPLQNTTRAEMAAFLYRSFADSLSD